MEWFDEKPGSPGFYWYLDTWVFDVVRVYRSAEGRLKATGTAMYEGQQLDQLHGQWAGPIPLPVARRAMNE